MMNASATTVDEYLVALPDAARATLGDLTRVIRATTPDAVESISHGIPTFKYRGKPLIYFGAAKKHCAIYGTSAGTVRFPPDAPLEDGYVAGLLRERMAAIEARKGG